MNNEELERVWKKAVVEQCGSYSCISLAFQVFKCLTIGQPVWLSHLCVGSSSYVVTVPCLHNSGFILHSFFVSLSFAVLFFCPLLFSFRAVTPQVTVISVFVISQPSEWLFIFETNLSCDFVTI
jgi:hypothetical protein